jgi:hypothetical protein
MNNGPRIEYLREAGTHRVKVIKTEKKKSKNGNDMLVVTFADVKSREINAYYVATNRFGLEALSELKDSLELPQTAKGPDMIGRACLIVVGFQDPNKTGGKLFTQVEKSMPLDADEEEEFEDEDPPPPTDDDLPF